ADLRARPRRRRVLRPRALEHRRDRRPHGGMGLGEQVLAHRRAPGGGAADRGRAPPPARGGPGRAAGGAPGAPLRAPSLPGAPAPRCFFFSPWNLAGFVFFRAAAAAESRRPPFDMPVADSEIIFGAYTEYTGLKFAFFLLAEYGGIVVMSAIAAVLYLGGF